MIDVVAAILLSEDYSRILLTQRTSDDFKFHWCHPGGKVDADEDRLTALRRELEEEIGIVLSPNADFPLFDRHSFEPPVCRDPTELNTYLIEHPIGPGYDVRLLDATCGAGWFTPTEMGGLRLTPGLRRLLPRLHKLCRTSPAESDPWIDNYVATMYRKGKLHVEPDAGWSAG